MTRAGATGPGNSPAVWLTSPYLVTVSTSERRDLLGGISEGVRATERSKEVGRQRDVAELCVTAGDIANMRHETAVFMDHQNTGSLSA